MLLLEETVSRETDVCVCVCVANMLVSLRHVQMHTRSSHSPEGPLSSRGSEQRATLSAKHHACAHFLESGLRARNPKS
jgi:hypothetical protein